jgi:hypothetical protein
MTGIAKADVAKEFATTARAETVNRRALYEFQHLVRDANEI